MYITYPTTCIAEYISHVKWHLCITVGRKVVYLNHWLTDSLKISDVLPFTVATILYLSISLISSPLTHYITRPPSPLHQASGIPLFLLPCSNCSSTLLFLLYVSLLVQLFCFRVVRNWKLWHLCFPYTLWNLIFRCYYFYHLKKNRLFC